MQEVISVTKALADENRVRILCALNGKKLCVCQIVELLRLAPSTVSKHLSILKQAGLITERKEGKFVFHTLAGRTAKPAVRQIIRWLAKNLADDKQIQNDQKKLEQILRIDPWTLCDLQAKR